MVLPMASLPLAISKGTFGIAASLANMFGLFGIRSGVCVFGSIGFPTSREVIVAFSKFAAMRRDNFKGEFVFVHCQEDIRGAAGDEGAARRNERTF